MPRSSRRRAGRAGAAGELCRRLQQQNGALEQRARAQAADEEARRAALLAQFRGGLAGIQEKIDAEGRERAALAADNERMRAELERLAGAAAAAQAAAARERAAPAAALAQREKECAALRLRNRVLELRVGEVEAAEAQQRAQLEEYTARMREFRDALAESNALFESYAARLTEVCCSSWCSCRCWGLLLVTGLLGCWWGGGG